MRFLRLVMAACATLFVLGSCAGYVPHAHLHENYYRRHHVDPNRLHMLSQWCEGIRCQRVVHFDSHCLAVGDDGKAITNIDANIGTHICFYNDTGCPLVLKFGDVLFGPAHSDVTIDTGTCATLIVTQEAASRTFTIDQICTCVEGHGHANPTVRVGEDEEP